MTGPPTNRGHHTAEEGVDDVWSNETERPGGHGRGGAHRDGRGGPKRRARPSKVGGLATLEGALHGPRPGPGTRGLNLALKEHNAMAGGKKIELITGSSDASPDSAVKRGAQAGGAGRRAES